MMLPFDKRKSDSLVWERWCSNAEKYPNKDAIVHWVAGEKPYRWTFKRLLHTSAAIAALLRRNGVRNGEVCAIIIKHNPYFYPLYLAVSAIGAIPAVLAYPNARLHPDKFRQSLAGMSQHSGLDWIFTERALEETITPLVFHDKSTIRGLHFPLEWLKKESHKDQNYIDELKEIEELRGSMRPSDPVLLQHSSGTTGLQKGVMLSHQAILDHVTYYGIALNLTKNDKIINWLPLYHDMGLIAAFQLPLAFGITTVQIDPFEWVLYPLLLLEAITKEKGTLAWLPNFAYNLMAEKIHEDALAHIDLGSIRMLINCSEPVRAESHEIFLRRFSKCGLKRRSLTACYAMAETTFAVTQTTPGEPAAVVVVDRDALAKGTIKLAEASFAGPVRRCVSSGQPIAGVLLRIIGQDGSDLEDDTVGEIVIRSASLFNGYKNNPKMTAMVFKDGWYCSGDYGFRHKDEYFMVGRKKDIIIVAGKNIYPEDIEDAISRVPGVAPGRVVAFGEEDSEMGTERIGVIAEIKPAVQTDKNELKKLIYSAGLAMDLTITKIYLVPPRWLIKSSSGKPSRKINKERILQLEPQ